MCKNRFCLMLIVLISFMEIFVGCKYSAVIEYYNDPKQYADIWDLSGVRDAQEEKNTIFPKNINDLEVVTFFCRYDQQHPLGEGIQILLEIKYFDAEEFQREVDTLSQQCFCVDDYFTDLNKVFAIRFGEDDGIEGENDGIEYAAINENEQVISYVYLDDLPKEQIEIDSKFIPNGYYGYSTVKKKG